MKKIINGKVYDTSTAERVGGWNNNCSTSDFGYCSEDLYRKRTGEFFLFARSYSSLVTVITILSSDRLLIFPEITAIPVA